MKDKINYLEKNIDELINILNIVKNFEANLESISKKIHKKIKKGGKIYLCGNGGSAADAQHLAAEFLVRLRPNINRDPIAAVSLAMDTSTITACGNDYNFNDLFSRNLKALANKKDILIAISTSGKSKNILKALQFAKKKNIYSFCLLGNKGGLAKLYCDDAIIVPSNNVARIQEAHILIGHSLFEKIEDLILEKK